MIKDTQNGGNEAATSQEDDDMKQIMKFTNEIEGIESRIYKHAGGKLHVTLYDTDAGITAWSVRIFSQAMKKSAVAYAKKLANVAVQS